MSSQNNEMQYVAAMRERPPRISLHEIWQTETTTCLHDIRGYIYVQYGIYVYAEMNTYVYNIRGRMRAAKRKTVPVLSIFPI